MIAEFERAPAAARVFLVAGAAVALNAAYCIAYTASLGRGETLGEALLWGLINIAPWAAAIELGRRESTVPRLASLIGAALLAVIALQALGEPSQPALFRSVRALPGLLVTLAAIGALRALRQRRRQRVAGPLDLSLARDSKWIAAAGNYLELHREDGVALARSTLARASESLGDAYVRIHRSYLVRRSAIRRVDRDSVLLECGKRLPVGAAFRAALEAG